MIVGPKVPMKYQIVNDKKEKKKQIDSYENNDL